MENTSQLGPDPTTEGQLSARDELNTRPRPAFQHSDEGGVVHPDELREASEAMLVDPLAEGEDDAPSDLPSTVVTLGVGPGRAELSGALSADADHGTHGMCDPSGYLFNHPLRDELENYRPRHPKHWTEIRLLVLHIVALTQKRAHTQVQMHIRFARDFILWAWQEASCELTLADIFTEANVRVYLSQAPSAGAHSAEMNRTASLSKMVLAVTGARPTLRPREQLGPAPYSAKELGAVWSTVIAASTPWRRVNGRRIVALAIGAGLTPLEIQEVRYRDLHGTHVTVRGEHARIAPVLPEWREELTLDGDPDTYIVVPDALREGPHAKAVGEFLGMFPTPRPVPRRLRSTYIVTILAAGISAQDFVAVTGRDTAGALNKYRDFLPDRSTDLITTFTNLFKENNA